EKIQMIARRAALPLLEMPLETLRLGEELHVGRELVEDADRVTRVQGGNEAVARLGHRAQMSWRDVPRDPRGGEVLPRKSPRKPGGAAVYSMGSYGDLSAHAFKFAQFARARAAADHGRQVAVCAHGAGVRHGHRGDPAGVPHRREPDERDRMCAPLE